MPEETHSEEHHNGQPFRITPEGIQLADALAASIGLSLSDSDVGADDLSPNKTAAAPSLDPLSLEAIERELAAFETQQRERLGIEEEVLEHWVDENPQEFTATQRAHTTILCGGLTHAQDVLMQAAVEGLGYKVKALDIPDIDALRLGKEFGNRGQCNPTYFTVGNLVKFLQHLRDVEGMSVDEINEKYLLLTAGACGPCRFGTYVTEFRKAMRDAGFEGFRILLFQQQGGFRQATGDGLGLKLNPQFFFTLLKALIAGDLLNGVGYRIRPYEVNAGDTDRALEDCKTMLGDAFRERRSILWTLWRCRQRFATIAVDRIQPKPKVMVIGEFWAMTTEGDGNYKLQRFLESEGAEVDVQPVTAWLLYNLWQVRWDTLKRMRLREDDTGHLGLSGKNPRIRRLKLLFAEKALRAAFQTFAHVIGFTGYHLPDMQEVADLARPLYPNELRGGEGHMEVGKLIQAVTNQKAHMVVSVKPFGCMPSSAVSDGVQSLVTKQYPEAIFCPIETSGDGAVNVHSRVQMYLFKARKKARAELDAALEKKGLDSESAQAQISKRRSRALHYPKHQVAGTAANVILGL